jgi:hypothetical protein
MRDTPATGEVEGSHRNGLGVFPQPDQPACDAATDDVFRRHEAAGVALEALEPGQDEGFVFVAGAPQDPRNIGRVPDHTQSVEALALHWRGGDLQDLRPMAGEPRRGVGLPENTGKVRRGFDHPLHERADGRVRHGRDCGVQYEW